MRRVISLQRRLSLGLALGVTALWLVATVAAGLVIRHEFDEAFDSALQETAQRLLPLAVIDIMEREDDLTGQLVAPLAEHDEFLTYLVRDRTGRMLLWSHDADPAVFPQTPMVGFRDTATHRIYGESAISGTIFIEVAEPLQHRQEATWEAVVTLFAPLAVLVPLSLFGVWWLVRVTLRPLRRFTRDIEARGGADLSPVAADGIPAELEPVAGAVNRLIDRLRRVLEAERSFSANSAHELRTPIAATLAQAQRLIAETPDGPLRHRAQRIETALHQLSRLSEKLMQLVKAEGGGLLSETAHDLAPILTHVVETLRTTSQDQSRIQLTLPSDDATISNMDPDAFAILARNLIENALRHGAPDAPVEVSMTGRTLTVVNAGPVVAPDTLAKLKSRFARGATLAQGSGLGLAIAETIAAGSGGRLDLVSPARGRADGFEATAHLPGCDSEAAGG